MIFRCERLLADRAQECGLPATGQWNFLIHNNYHPNYPSLNLFCYVENERFPRFHVRLLAGRKKQAEQAYSAIQHYFEHTAAWHRVFLGDKEEA